MEYEYEWKDECANLNRVVFGPTVSAAMREAATEDAERYGIEVKEAIEIILNGMVAADMAKEEMVRKL